MAKGLPDKLRHLFGGDKDKKVVGAKDILNNKVAMKNPFGKSAGVAVHQKIAEAELESQSKEAAKKAKK